MSRFALCLEYIGQHYAGFQKQFGRSTIQSHLEAALSQIADEAIDVQCAGRTDAGVHAIAQIVHFDTQKHRVSTAWVAGTNTYLPPDIRVQWVLSMPDDFHARFSATARRYHYFLDIAPVPSAIWQGRVGWHYRALDTDAMQQAANFLLGEHDFSAFRGSECQAKHAVRTLHEFEITQHGRLIRFNLRANAFLHHMVRNLVGSLVLVGSGEQTSEWMRGVLESRDRTQAGMTWQPDGLYLVDVEYPVQFKLPKNTRQLFF